MGNLALSLLNIGLYANDRTGDPLRTAFQKINNNFTIVSTGFGNLGNLANLINITGASALAIPNTLALRDNFANTAFNGLSANIITANGFLSSPNISTTILSVTSQATITSVQAETLTINNLYTFPINTGTPGQALVYNGNGAVVWGNVSGGGGNVTVPGTTTQMIFNLAGNLGAAAGITTDGNNLHVAGNITSPGANQQLIFNRSGNLAGSANIVTDGANLYVSNELSVRGGPVFNPITNYSFANSIQFNMAFGSVHMVTLNGNVTSSNAVSAIDGFMYTIILTENANGFHSFTWPSNFQGATTINGTLGPGNVGSQTFIYVGSTSNFYPVTSFVSNQS
jgi:hypothetical protein